MKILTFVTLIAAFSTVFNSCNKFLEVQPANQLIVQSLDDVEKLLGGYLIGAVQIGNTVNAGLSVLDPINYFGVHYYSDEFSFYQWGKNNGLDYINNETLARLADFKCNSQGEVVWNGMYNCIGIMNAVVIEANNSTKGNQDQKDYILGEARTWRAYCYLKLLQYFSPYYLIRDYEADISSMGVPIITDGYKLLADVDLRRKTQKEVYELIISDLDDALKRLQRSLPKQGFSLFYNDRFINGMLAKVYWYKALSPAKETDDWTNAEKYATAAIGGRKLSTNIDEFRKIFDTGNKESSNNECPLRIVKADGNGTLPFQYLRTRQTDLSYTQFTDNDIRKSVYFTTTNFILDPNQIGTLFMDFTQNKHQTDLLTGNYLNYWWSDARLSEMFLIRAEAVERQGRNARPMLDEFQESRYLSGQPVTSGSVLEDIIAERRKEFIYEIDHRWIDNKRLAVAVTRTIDGNTYTLDGNDYRYCLRIPDRELELNIHLNQNPGWFNQ